MDTLIRGTALLRAVLLLCLATGLLCAAGCARYEQKPLLTEEFQRVLAERAVEATEKIKEQPEDSREPSDQVTLEQAELVALYLNPRLRSARHRALVPAASARYAGLWDDPVFNADVLRIVESSKAAEAPWILASSLGFTVPISGRLAVAKDQAQAKARAAIVQVWGEEQVVLRELREAWADWSAAHGAMQVSRDHLNRLSELVELTNRFEELGEMIAAEAVAFRLAAVRARLGFETAEATERQKHLVVLELMGLTPEASVELLPSNAIDKTPELPSPDILYSRSPAILLAAARYNSAEEGLRLEIRKQYPDLSLSPQWEEEEDLHRLGIGISIPIPILNANKRGIAEAHAARDEARAAWEQAVQESIAALARAQAALEAAGARRETLVSTVIPLANEQIAEARRLADLGEINTLLLLEALQSQRQAQIDLIRAEADVARAHASLRAVLPAAPPAFETLTDEEPEQ